MDKEQIIQMARDAGIHQYNYTGVDDALERFAAAIIKYTKEQDAKICENYGENFERDDYKSLAFSCADGIRASK